VLPLGYGPTLVRFTADGKLRPRCSLMPVVTCCGI